MTHSWEDFCLTQGELSESSVRPKMIQNSLSLQDSDVYLSTSNRLVIVLSAVSNPQKKLMRMEGM